MADLKDLCAKSATFKAFAKGYFSYLDSQLKAMDVDALDRLLRVFLDARDHERTVFIVGNGGSAATASHMANDFSVGIAKSAAGVKPFRVLSLTDNVPVLTALGNDLGFDSIFLNQLQSLYRKDDVLLAISASGNSPNLVQAAEWVKGKGGTVMSLVGFDGGALKKLSEPCIQIVTPKGEYGPVEDIHMIIDHVLYTWISHCVKTGGRP